MLGTRAKLAPSLIGAFSPMGLREGTGEKKNREERRLSILGQRPPSAAVDAAPRWSCAGGGVPLTPHQEKENTIIFFFLKSKNPALTIIKLKPNASLVISFSRHCQGRGGGDGAAREQRSRSRPALASRTPISWFSPPFFPVPQLVVSPRASP